MLLTGYAGTYASEDNKSLWRFEVDAETGALSKPEPVLAAADSKYLFLQSRNLQADGLNHAAENLQASGSDRATENLQAAAGKTVPKLLAVPRKVHGKAGLAVVNVAVNPVQVVGEYSEEQDCSAYVTGDGEFWYTANYHDGEIRIYKLARLAQDFPGNKMAAAEILASREKVAPGIAKDSGSAAPNLKLIHKIATGHESGCHQIILAGQFVLAVCLLRDQILIYDRSKNWQQVGVVNFSKGTGPRHGIFDKAGKKLFLVSELANELFIFAAGEKLATRKNLTPKKFEDEQNFTSIEFPETQNFTANKFSEAKNDFLNLISIQPLVAQNNLSAAAAAIRLSPDERFLYVSVRERNVICVFELAHGKKVTENLNGHNAATTADQKTLAAMHLIATKIQEISCGGNHPRDMVLTPDGKFVLAVNRYPGSIVSFKRDAGSGKIGPQCGSINIPQAVSVVLGKRMI